MGYMTDMAPRRTRTRRTADPWRDTDVIDERAPRFNQAVTGLVALLGALFGWPLAWALMAAQLLIGLTLGRRFCLPCAAYFLIVQPRFGEGRLEDSRPPRLANVMGSFFLGSAALAWWLGAAAVGTALGLLVAALAWLAASTGFCLGCEIYRLAARLRGISPGHHGQIDAADLDGVGGIPAYVEFTHPLCSECHEWERRLGSEPEPLLKLDVSDRPDLARKYGVAIVPTVLRVAADGSVLARLAP
jgi:zinc transporter ZupT